MGVYRQGDGMQKLPSSTHSRISLAATAVHLTLVLCGLIYVSSEQAIVFLITYNFSFICLYTFKQKLKHMISE